MSKKDTYYFGQPFKPNGKSKLWEESKNEIKLQGKIQFIYNQIIHSVPKYWKDALIANSEMLKT